MLITVISWECVQHFSTQLCKVIAPSFISPWPALPACQRSGTGSKRWLLDVSEKQEVHGLCEVP